MAMNYCSLLFLVFLYGYWYHSLNVGVWEKEKKRKQEQGGIMFFKKTVRYYFINSPIMHGHWRIPKPQPANCSPCI
jgi:hypothetical protein